MPSPHPLPKNLRRVMISFRALPSLKKAFENHVPKKSRSAWLVEAVEEKLKKEGVKVEETNGG